MLQFRLQEHDEPHGLHADGSTEQVPVPVSMPPPLPCRLAHASTAAAVFCHSGSSLHLPTMPTPLVMSVHIGTPIQLPNRCPVHGHVRQNEHQHQQSWSYSQDHAHAHQHQHNRHQRQQHSINNHSNINIKTSGTCACACACTLIWIVPFRCVCAFLSTFAYTMT